MSQLKECKSCSVPFEVSRADLKFYDSVSPVICGKKFAIPSPEVCANCRAQQRLIFRNFFSLYHGMSALTGRSLLTMYAPGVLFPVYEMHEWWSDAWDELAYGLRVDFQRPFLEQIYQLHQSVPRMSIVNTQCENTDYCNFSFQSKDCYMIGGNVCNESCCYGHIVWQSKNCFDCLYVYRSELCYESVDCVQCYEVAFSVGADNCSRSSFLLNCSSCKNCFGCSGLKGKEYHIFNKAFSKSDYEAELSKIWPRTPAEINALMQRVKQQAESDVVKHYHGFSCENVTGDYLYNCKNTFDSYDAKNCEDIRYCATVESFVDSHDCNFSPARTELTYNCLTVAGYNLLFCHSCPAGSSHLIYCDNCYSSKNCFGCVGLKGKQYCILNRQYSKADYESRVSKVIEHMMSSGEWGEFFPAHFSPFAYNETMANEYFPLTRPQALEQGLSWKDEEEGNYQPQEYEVFDSIDDIPDSILNKVLACEDCRRNYKIVRSELNFLRNIQLPIPRKCFYCRHQSRMTWRNPRKLFVRQCSNCKVEVQTTFTPENQEYVFCEDCFTRTSI